MIKYEYRVAEIPTVKLQDALTEYGLQGFQLSVADATTHGIYRLVLIRPQATGKLALLEE